MSVSLFRTSPPSRIFVGTFVNADLALAGIQNIVYAEADKDFPGYWDVFAASGDLYTIEPVKVDAPCPPSGDLIHMAPLNIAS